MVLFRYSFMQLQQHKHQQNPMDVFTNIVKQACVCVCIYAAPNLTEHTPSLYRTPMLSDSLNLGRVLWLPDGNSVL